MATDNSAAMPPCERVVHSTEETATVAAALLPGMIKAGTVSLEGPLGAGKTHFVKATARALGITEGVTSPTFTLLHSYGSGESRLHHSDWYRLESAAEALALGLEDYQGEGLMMIEWGDKFPEILPSGTLRIRIEPRSDESRLISWREAQR
jgi:tRNA threonylcarbamoyladenosine biosynthesis protein TsaE